MAESSLPTDEEAFNQLPTDEEAFGTYEKRPEQTQTYSGPVADHFFNTGSLGQLAKTVLTAVPKEVLNIADSWNSSPDLVKEFDKTPGHQEFLKGHGDWKQSVNEAWMRPSIYALDAAQRAWNIFGSEMVRPVQGLADLSGETSKEFETLDQNSKNPILKGIYKEQRAAYGIGAEMLSGIASGAVELGHFPHPGSPLETVIKSKSEGMIGDSGLGSDGKLSPETEAARNQATGQIVPVPQDIHGATRNLAPETFSDYDNLRAHQQTLRTTLNGLQESQAENPRFTELSAQIDNILGKVNGVEERLTDKAADRLDSLRDELRDTPKKVDSEDMAQIRHDLQVTDYKLRDLAPDVSAVYHEAAKRYGYDLYDSRKNGNSFSEPLNKAEPSSSPQGELPPDASGSPQTASQGLPGTEVASNKQARVEAPKGSSDQSGVQSQAIFDDTVARLTAAGRPLEEAQTAGKLLQSHYEARAARFRGKLGTAEELYKKEAPDVVSFNRRTKGKSEPKEVTLNQADEPPKPANDESGKQELEPFHKRFVENVKQRAEEARKRGEEYHANGKLPFEVGTRFKTPKSTETNQGPWEVAGYFVDSKNPDRYGYYVKRGTKDVDLESTIMLVNDSKRPEVAEYAKNYQLFTDLKILEQGRRGSLTLREGRKNLIKLFSKADASTFFHESGHQWLEELIQDSQHPEAPGDLKADAQSVRDWLGNKGEAITTKQHEQFARGFETYLMEGRAPNAELASVFQKFKEWLTKIYETIKTLNSPISDEVRGVFDRLVADPNKPVDMVSKDKPIDSVEDKSIDTTSEDKSIDTVGDKPTAPVSRETVIAPDQKAPEARTNLDVINDTNLKATQTPPSFDSTAEVSQEQPETKHVDKAGNVRLDTLNLDTDVIESIKDLVQTNEQSKGWAKAQGKVTPQDAIDYSNTSGLSPSEVSLQKLEEVFSDTGISVSNAIKAAREMYASVGQQIYDIAMKGEGNELDYISAIQKFARIDNVLQKASPESGRILKAWDRKAAEAAEKIQGLNEYLQGAIGKDLATIRKEMKAWELAKTAEQRAKNARNSYKASLGQMMVEWVQNAWISGPFTHAYYIADIGLRTVEKNLLEAPVSAAIGSIQKVFSKDIDSVSWGEVGDKLYGLFDGGRKGIMAAARAAKLGVPQGIRLLDLAREKADYEISQGTITEAQRETRVKELLDNPTKDMEYKSTPSQPFIDQYKKIPGKLGSVIRAPGERMVNPLHTIGYSVNFATNLSGAISRTARLEGEAKSWTKAQVTQRMAELHYDTPTDLIQEARDAALDMGLMNKSGPYTGKLSAVLGHEFDIPILGKTPVGQIVNPFIGMVSKAIKKAVKGAAFTNPVTPFAYKDFRQSIFGADNIARQEALAKVVVGATVFSAVWSLLDQGNMNGPAPDKPTEALVSKMVYGMPNSFRVGDMSYGLDHLGSFGLRLAIIGDIHQFKGDVQTENFSKALGGLFNNLQHDILSTKAISGVSDFLEAVEHPDRFGQKYVNNFLVSGGTPFSTALNQTSTRMDDYSRRVSADGKTGVEGELQLLLEQEKSIIPKWRESLQPKVDLLGNDVPSESHWGMYASQISSDPVYQMLIQNKYFPSPVQSSIKIGGNSVPLNDEQYHEYAKKSGAGARVLLDYYLDQPFWQNASETMKHHWIQTAFSQARKEAIQSILPQPQYLDLLNKSLSMNQDFVNGVQ